MSIINCNDLVGARILYILQRMMTMQLT